MILLLHPDSACFCKPHLCVETLTNGQNLGVSRKQFVPWKRETISRAYSNSSRGVPTLLDFLAQRRNFAERPEPEESSRLSRASAS
jgi:hypothetical protein